MIERDLLKKSILKNRRDIAKESPFIKGGKGVIFYMELKHMKIYYNPKLKQLARNLRNHSTLAEVLLWVRLKGRQRMGYQFSRQKPIGNYIVDFYGSKLKLVIEIDGESHFRKEKSDAEKQTFLESIGLTVLRFDDDQVKQDMERMNNALIGISGKRLMYSQP